MAKHVLDTTLAAKHGVNIALLLENFAFWISKNLQRNKHIHDGLCWSYDTLESLGEAFNYWTRRQIEHTINNAVKAGLLVKGNYNQTKYDRTVWYALTPKAYAYYPDLLEEIYLQRLYLSISQNCEIDYTNFRNGFPRIVTTIPDTDPDTDPDINKGLSAESPNSSYNETENAKSDYPDNHDSSSDSDRQVIDREMESTKSDYFDNRTLCKKGDHTGVKKDRPSNETKRFLKKADYEADPRFMQFYNAYPVKKKGGRAYSAWLSLNPSNELIETILADISDRMANDSQWREGFIEHPTTYLNNKIWQDEIVNRDKLKNTQQQVLKAKAVEEANKKLKALEEAQEMAAKQKAVKQSSPRPLSTGMRQGFRSVRELVGLK